MLKKPCSCGQHTCPCPACCSEEFAKYYPEYSPKRQEQKAHILISKPNKSTKHSYANNGPCINDQLKLGIMSNINKLKGQDVVSGCETRQAEKPVSPSRIRFKITELKKDS